MALESKLSDAPAVVGHYSVQITPFFSRSFVDHAASRKADWGQDLHESASEDEIPPGAGKSRWRLMRNIH